MDVDEDIFSPLEEGQRPKSDVGWFVILALCLVAMVLIPTLTVRYEDTAPWGYMATLTVLGLVCLLLIPVSLVKIFAKSSNFDYDCHFSKE